MRRRGTFFFGGAFALVDLGCNSLLENERGRLDRGVSAPDDESGAESIRGGADQDANGWSEGPGSGGEGGGDVGTTPDAGAACNLGQKACGTLCVSMDDPFFGCAAPTCGRCEVANATAACVLGACAVGACVVGFGDCNSVSLDGCETNLQTVNDCGGCGLKCPAVKNADVACVGGACVGTCQPGFGDCNGKVADGCEKNLLGDKNNCGACGMRCAFGRCERGACVWGG